jgi:sulfatase modifying factor 1
MPVYLDTPKGDGMPKISHKDYTALYLLMIVLMATLLPQAGRSAQQTFRNSIGMEFVLIPAGSFVMGSPKSEKGRDGGGREIQHQVTLTKPIYMQTTEVTVDQWESIMGKKLIGWRRGAGNMPITRVSWKDCQKFIKKLNARGERACSGCPRRQSGSMPAGRAAGPLFRWGEDYRLQTRPCTATRRRPGIVSAVLPAVPQDSAWEAGCPLKPLRPTAWGLFDMHGNVWEWCQDRYGDYNAENVSRTPSVPKKAATVCGGAAAGFPRTTTAALPTGPGLASLQQDRHYRFQSGPGSALGAEFRWPGCAHLSAQPARFLRRPQEVDFLRAR